MKNLKIVQSANDPLKARQYEHWKNIKTYLSEDNRRFKVVVETYFEYGSNKVRVYAYEHYEGKWNSLLDKQTLSIHNECETLVEFYRNTKTVDWLHTADLIHKKVAKEIVKVFLTEFA